MEDGIPVYSISNMKKIMGNIYELNVKEGEEFYIKLINILGCSDNCSNSNEFKDYLDDFGKNGKSFKTDYAYYAYNYTSNHITNPIYHPRKDYYKFKAMKQSINKISLKFFIITTALQNAYELGLASYFIKINILSKDETL